MNHRDMIIVSFYLLKNDIGQAGIVYQIDGTGILSLF